jgi:MFS family permease
MTAARYLPILLFGSWGGLVADRYNKRRLLRVTGSSQACISATIGVLTLTHVATIWSLAVLIVAAGTVDVFDTPSRQTFINNLVGRDLLPNAIALNSIIVNASRIIGPGAAGFIIAGLGVGPCFVANAISYGAVIVSLQMMRPSELIESSVETRAAGQIRAVLRYVLNNPTLLVALVLVAVSGTFAWEFQVTLPLLTSVIFHGSSTAYGGALASLAAGSIGGGFIAARRKVVTTQAVGVSAVIWGIFIIAASAAPALVVAYLLLAFVGACAVTFNSASKTLLQIESAEYMRGRVMSLWSIGWQGSTVVGAPIVGFVGQELGARYSLAFGGVTTLLSGIIVLLWLSRLRAGAADRHEARSRRRRSHATRD